jgi:hypothetical protein
MSKCVCVCVNAFFLSFSRRLLACGRVCDWPSGIAGQVQSTEASVAELRVKANEEVRLLELEARANAHCDLVPDGRVVLGLGTPSDALTLPAPTAPRGDDVIVSAEESVLVCGTTTSTSPGGESCAVVSHTLPNGSVTAVVTAGAASATAASLSSATGTVILPSHLPPRPNRTIDYPFVTQNMVFAFHSEIVRIRGSNCAVSTPLCAR